MKGRVKKEIVFDRLLPESEMLPRGEYGPNQGTAYLLADLLEMSPEHVNTTLNTLRREGRAHIYDWTVSVPSSSVWTRGPGPDAPKLGPAGGRPPSRPIATKLRERKEKPGLSIERTRKTIEQARAQPHSWLSSLGDVGEL